MAKKCNYIVNAPTGLLNLREEPRLDSKILAKLKTGDKIKLDLSVKTPEEWKAVEGGGYVMAEFLK